ncbi:hypothetical protein [Streptomyces sp. A5-4]|uniref:hypothetical protein n=1 Tax=Streptomyces sp. A5-4 TaxID=3384771 RepID=UPI003DAA320D
MAELLVSHELDVVVDHRLVGLLDEACAAGERPPSPHTLGHWLSTTPGMVYLESDEDILGARLRLEAWDGDAPFVREQWPRTDVIVLDLPSGVLGVDEIAAGGKSQVFRVPSPGRWHARVSWRPGVLDLDGTGTEPEAWALVQFWPVAE